MKNKKFKEALDGDITTFREAVKTFSKDDVPAIFWTAFSWGSYINITRTDVAGLADLSKVQALIEFVAEKDPLFYHGSCVLISCDHRREYTPGSWRESRKGERTILINASQSMAENF